MYNVHVLVLYSLMEIKGYKKLAHANGEGEAYSSIDPSQQQMFKKLIMLGLKDENEEQLLV